MNFKAPSLSKTIILFIGGMLLGFGTAFLFMVVKMVITPSNFNTFSQIALLMGEALIPVPVLIWALKNRIALTDTFRFHRVKVRYFFYALLAGVGLVLVSDEVERIIGMFFTIPDQLQGLDQLLTISDWPSAILIISGISIIGPLAEEMVFRGFLQQSLEQNLQNITRAVIYTALAFMIVHFNIFWALNIFIIGFFLSFVGWKTNSIWPTFIVHMMNNSLALVFVHFDEKIETFYLFHGHVHPLIFLAGLFVLVYFMVKLTKLKNLA